MNFKLPPVFTSVCDKVSLADFLVIASDAVMGRLETGKDMSAPYYQKGSLARNLRDGFKFGRVTNMNCNEPTHLMPNPEDGCDGLDNIFVKHIFAKTGHPWTLTAAISGVHTLGSAKKENSGYEGFWSSTEN